MFINECDNSGGNDSNSLNNNNIQKHSQHETKTNCATSTRAMDWLRIVYTPPKRAYTHICKPYSIRMSSEHIDITYKYVPFFLSNNVLV